MASAGCVSDSGNHAVYQIGVNADEESGDYSQTQDYASTFEVELEGDDYSAFLESVSDYYESYDPNEEALLWAGPDGHGMRGAPHRTLLRKAMSLIEASA